MDLDVVAVTMTNSLNTQFLLKWASHPHAVLPPRRLAEIALENTHCVDGKFQRW